MRSIKLIIKFSHCAKICMNKIQAKLKSTKERDYHISISIHLMFNFWELNLNPKNDEWVSIQTL